VLVGESDPNKRGVEKYNEERNETMQVKWLKTINRERRSKEQD
jgi:hypothetical protein